MSAVGFLGLGAMGHAMADRLLRAGNDVRVWNRTPGRDEDLVSAGAMRAATPADAVRDVEVAITMVTDPPALEEVLFSTEGAASALPRTATLIEMSTVGPTAIASVAQRLAPTAVLDAPVLGSVPSVEAGRLVVLVGGDRAVFDRHADLLAVFGRVLHVGELGAGAMLKLVNNAATISTLVGLGELLALTDRAGLDADAVLESLEAGPLASLVERWRPRLEGSYDRPDFRLALARKDLAIAFDEAERAGVDLTVPEVAAARCDQALDAGLGDRDFGAIVPFLRR
jgi:3-hydroxyisobutyrate dehydrogenase